ncbi:MAG TPA: HTTM domain-containing protein [Actinomycetota bacterium]|nr:HTTM domain-containing protein [Actinomycetota bacterium]
MPALAGVAKVPDLRARSRPIGVARALVGSAGLLGAVEVAGEIRNLSNPNLLRLPRFDGLSAPPPSGANLLLAVWILLAAAFALGWHTRVAGTLFAVLIGYTLALDQQLYSNHLYLMSLLVVLLTLGDAGAAWSLDARRKGARPSVPGWPALLMRFQVSVVYGFAMLSKLTPAYLSGLVLATNLRLPGLQSVPPPVFAMVAILSVLTEAFLAMGLWSSRYRPVAVVVGLGFHLTILLTMRILPDLLTFALLMSAGYIAFLTPISPTYDAEPAADKVAAGA